MLRSRLHGLETLISVAVLLCSASDFCSQTSSPGQLNEFVPANTYDAEVAYAPDSNRWEAQSVEVAQLRLKGAGLKGERPLVLLDGAPTDIAWDCSDSRRALGSKDSPVTRPAQLCGNVLNDGHIELYRIAKITVSGLETSPEILGVGQQMWVRRPIHSVALALAQSEDRGPRRMVLRR